MNKKVKLVFQKKPDWVWFGHAAAISIVMALSYFLMYLPPPCQVPQPTWFSQTGTLSSHCRAKKPSALLTLRKRAFTPWDGLWLTMTNFAFLLFFLLGFIIRPGATGFSGLLQIKSKYCLHAKANNTMRYKAITCNTMKYNEIQYNTKG